MLATLAVGCADLGRQAGVETAPPSPESTDELDVPVVGGSPSAPDSTQSPAGASEATAAAQDPVAETVLDVLTRSADFTTLLGAVRTAGLADTLRDAGPITVFAPTEDGFAAARQAVLEEIRGNPDQLAELLLAHVVRGRWSPDDLGSGSEVAELQTLAGTTIRVQRDNDDVITVNEQATITQPDLEAGNGVVHAIDAVLVPPDLEPGQG